MTAGCHQISSHTRHGGRSAVGRSRCWLLAGTAAIALAAFGPASLAQEADLETLLRERDVQIADLERRVELLERALAGPTGPGSLPPPPVRSVQPSGGPALEVDPLAAERALERTLVQTGNLLLPAGTLEVAPFVSYAHSDSNDVLSVIFVDDDNDGVFDDAVTDVVRARRDEIVSGVDIRFGLPYDAQIEASIPVVFANERFNQPLLRRTESNGGAGLGNIRVGLAKTLVREEGYLPDVIGRITYDSATGSGTSDGVTLDDDFHEIEGSVSLLKRQDPLAFSARFEYSHPFENDDLRPGASYGVSLGTFLAISPETSLSLGLGFLRGGDAEIGGVELDGTGSTQAVASFGISSILYRNVLANFTFGIGLTEDSPDFSVGLSFPVRFSFR